MTSCLLESSSIRKNKISLTDYDYQKDIKHRLSMAHFSKLDLEILEEILYNSLQIPLSKLAKNLDIPLEVLIPTLEALQNTELFTLHQDSIVVDKEKRKYFEMQLQKFDEQFEPGMEFLQSLLKKVPIHTLPNWYSIPRTSDNIFDSIVEKYLLTPQIFQRYVAELNLGEPILKKIIDDVFSSEDLELSSESLMNKYNITRPLFEEYMLHLEFNFVCCLGYRKVNGTWEEKVTPFHEWRTYLQFLRDTEVHSSIDSAGVTLVRPEEFSFVIDLAILLELIKKSPLIEISQLLATASFVGLDKNNSVHLAYLERLIDKSILLRLCIFSGKQLEITQAGIEWLLMKPDAQAMYLYRHPKNCILNIPEELKKERLIKEAEKSIVRVLSKGWVLFDDFLKGVFIPLSEDQTVVLKKTGKTWKYAIPEYSKTDIFLLEKVIFDWLFEAGIVQTGSFSGKHCFRVTSLGQTLFAR